LNLRFGIGAEVFGVDAFVDDFDLVLICHREATLLPVRRGNGNVAVFEVEQVQRVPGGDAQVVVQVAGEFGVEVEIGTAGAVVPLAEVDEFDVRKYLFGIQSFAPSGMREDDVRGEALAFEFAERAGDGLAMEDSSFHLAQIGVRLGLDVAVEFVFEPGEVVIADFQARLFVANDVNTYDCFSVV